MIRTEKAMPYLLNAELERTINDISDQFQKFDNETKKLPESEEVKNLEMLLKQLKTELEESSETIRETLRNEYIPELDRSPSESVGGPFYAHPHFYLTK